MAVSLKSRTVGFENSVILFNQFFRQSTVDEMAKAMTVAAVLDLHWEVKVNALQFWSQFINAHLNDQGMLDGIFPNVTFSKEHRKIVVLDGDEIRRRISKALDKLASQNCLSVSVSIT